MGIHDARAILGPYYCLTTSKGSGIVTAHKNNHSTIRRISIATQRVRVNREINAPQVRVISNQGEQVGVLGIKEALELARSHQLDLVEIAPTADPPVCKILDFNKYKYQLKKREKRQPRSDLKEMRLTTQIQGHDMDIKLRQMRKFLEQGHKIRVSIVFRGREIVHREQGQALIDRILAGTADLGKMDENAQSHGRGLQIILVPTRGSH